MTRFNGSSAEHQPEALGRWLEAAPGTSPPDDLDPEVVESVYALRPELAPAPRVSVEDILASLTAGPLAAPGAAPGPGGEHEAEVVPFPHRTGQPASEVSEEAGAPRGEGRRSGRLWWIGGTGGLGMAMVAAATLLLVVTPVLQPEPISETADRGASPASQVRAEPTEVEGEAAPPASPAQAPARDAGALAPAAGSRSGPVAAPAPGVLPMAGAPALDAPALIPELSERRLALGGADEDDEALLEDAVASADEVAGSVVEEAKAEDDGWRRGASAKGLARADAALAQADGHRAAGDRRGAAQALEAAASGVPARVGQHLLGLAALDWLAAGDPAAANAAVARGLALTRADSPERDRLMGLLGGMEQQAR